MAVKDCDELTGFDGFLVPEPFHLEVGVANRDETTLKVGCLTLREVVQVLQRLGEDRTLEGASFL